MKIIYSKHAREQMILRGISEREVEEGIKKGAKRFQAEDKILSEFRYYCVVYKKINQDMYLVITIKPRW